MNSETNAEGQVETVTSEPPEWISTDQLHEELQSAVIQATAEGPEEMADAVAEAHAYFAADSVEESEREMRSSLLTLLGHFRPQLAELLSMPSSSP